MKVRQRKKITARLMAALLRDDLPAVLSSLRVGADPNAADRDSTTPPVPGIRADPAAVRLLLQAGADPNTESGQGEEGTPLTGAAAWGHTDVVRVLLAHGADPNLREDHGSGLSPIEWALRGGHAEMAALLMTKGAPHHRGGHQAAGNPCSELR